LAHCVSVEVERPRASDTFLIDSNVLIYVAYSPLGQGEVARALGYVYSGFLQRCYNAGSKLYVSGLSYPEIANVVERFRWTEYGGDAVVGRKGFRELAPHREVVLADLEEVWRQVTSTATVLATTIDEAAVQRIATLFRGSRIDGYDGFLIDAARQAKIPNVITHDRDFASASNLVVFTANSALLS